jgi:hypothetical protein
VTHGVTHRNPAATSSWSGVGAPPLPVCVPDPLPRNPGVRVAVRGPHELAAVTVAELSGPHVAARLRGLKSYAGVLGAERTWRARGKGVDAHGAPECPSNEPCEASERIRCPTYAAAHIS